MFIRIPEPKCNVIFRGDEKKSCVGEVYPRYTPPKTSMTMENEPFQDVSPTKTGDFPACHVMFYIPMNRKKY